MCESLIWRILFDRHEPFSLHASPSSTRAPESGASEPRRASISCVTVMRPSPPLDDSAAADEEEEELPLRQDISRQTVNTFIEWPRLVPLSLPLFLLGRAQQTVRQTPLSLLSRFMVHATSGESPAHARWTPRGLPCNSIVLGRTSNCKFFRPVPTSKLSKDANARYFLWQF